MLQDPETSAVAFSTSPFYLAQEYVKMDAILAYNPTFALRSNVSCYAGVMMLRKTPKSIALIRDWLSLCETYRFLDESPSDAPESLRFKGNDCDNGLFNLCLQRHSIHATVPHTETNLYNWRGVQVHMVVNDWSSLDRFPFQCRRLRPNRGL